MSYGDVAQFADRMKKNAEIDFVSEKFTKGYKMAMNSVKTFCFEQMEEDSEYRKNFEIEQKQKVREFLVDVHTVKKTLNGLTPIAYCSSDSVAIAIDIRPWEDEYEIEINH
jgi:hypothetical protein